MENKNKKNINTAVDNNNVKDLPKQKTKTNYLFVIVYTIVIVALLVAAFVPIVKMNEAKNELSELKEELENIKNKNEKLENQLEQALDEETIRRIAKEELGMYDPNEEKFIGVE